jgi:cell division septal protein FtsQ
MNKAYNSKKFLNKKKRNKKIKIWIFSIFALMLLVGFVFWMRHPSLNVKEIEIVKNSFSKSENIQAKVSDVLGGDILFLIPKTNALLIPRSETEKTLKEEFPEIEKINIDLDGLSQISVEIYEYEPKIILQSEDKKFFVNKEGNIFLEEPMIHSYDSLLLFKKDIENVEVGWNVIDPDFLEDLNELKDSLEKIDLKVKKITYKEADVYYIETNKGFELLISDSDDLKESFENVKTILENGALDTENLDLVDYVDLRFGNKVFYKLKGE